MRPRLRQWAAADEAAASRELERLRQTDGLPIVVPTPERVEQMLLSCALDPDVVLGTVGPSLGTATVEKVAVNAVMAGCPADVFPIVVAAVEAICDPRFYLTGMQQTTHCVSPIIIVNGPARNDCNVSSGVGALGPGYRENLTIGRALRFVMMNIGGGYPGVGDMASLGSPAKLACCLAEAEEASPFEPLHVSLGFAPEDSVVTVLAGESPHSIFCSFSEQAEPRVLLNILASALCNLGSNNVHLRVGMLGLILNPLHARLLSDAGMDRRMLQEELWRMAGVQRGFLRAQTGAMYRECGGELPSDENGLSDDDFLRVVQSPEDILCVVSGDDGGAYSAWIPTWCSGGVEGNVAISRLARFPEPCDVPVSLRNR